VKESDDGFSVEVAVPGKKKEDFEVELNNNLLTISSEGKNKKESKEENFTRCEFSYSSFKRSFSLPDDIDASKISADYVDGIIKINLPKREELKVNPKRLIEIK